MKIDGKTLSLPTRTVEVRKGVSVTLTAPSLGFKREYEAIYPAPTPPSKVFNKVGAKPEVEKNWDDPKFVEQWEEHKQLQLVYMLYVSMRGCQTITFDTKVTDLESLRALNLEIKESGLSEGEIIYLVKQIQEMSEVTAESIKDAKENF